MTRTERKRMIAYIKETREYGFNRDVTDEELHRMSDYWLEELYYDTCRAVRRDQEKQ